MSNKFKIEIISPEKKIFEEKAESVFIPAFEGEMTILYDHIALITFLRPGIIKIYNGKETKFFVEEGTVEFSNNNLIILSSSIIEINTMTKEKISKILEDSKKELEKEDITDKARYIISHKIDCLSEINL